MAVELNIVAVSKRVPWVEDLPVEGPDYSGGTFKMEFRQDPGDTGTALVTLNNASAGSEGISATYDADYADPETGEAFGATVFLFHINEATMEGLAVATPTRSPVVLHYDLHVTPSGGTKFVLCYGTFTYMPGVVQ
ncbi:MAG: hypothetical protein V4696_10680 [Pseudomonadota bacterium]